MAVTVIYQDREGASPGAVQDGDDLWIPAEELPSATGWEIKPEGACLDHVCVPIPEARKESFLREGRFNFAALMRHLGHPLVQEPAHGVWLAGEPAASRRQALQSLQAPDFTLPDVEGKLHSLSDYRGKKVLLVSWASW